MADNMRAEARLPLIIFGDGMIAQQLRVKKGADSKEGVMYDEFKLRPTPTLKYYMGITDEELDPIDSGIIRKYRSDMVIPGNTDSTVGCIFILCDYNGRPAPLANLHSDLLYSSQAKDRKIKSLMYENASLHQERRRLTGQQARNVRETFDAYKPVAAFRSQELANMMPSQGKPSDDAVYEGP